jgi:hypothetical protein
MIIGLSLSCPKYTTPRIVLLFFFMNYCWVILILHIITNILFLNNIIFFPNNVIQHLVFGAKYVI